MIHQHGLSHAGYEHYQWQCPISSEHWVIKRCHIVIDGVGYTGITHKDYGLAVHGNAR